MKQKDAKQYILAEWLNLSDEDKYNQDCGFIFYGWLQKNRGDLLSFRVSGDKYQTINGWVLSWQSRFPPNF